MRILLPITAIAILAACGGQQAPAPEPAPEDPTPADNSRTSLDWAGTYSGTVPCADCEGIATRLTIHSDGTYVLQTQYLGKSDELFVKEGAFDWKEDGNHIVLQGIENGPSIYQVGENHLRQRDMSGNPITGELADNYVLRKAMPMAAMAARMSTEPVKPALEGTHWNLVELMGKPVPPPAEPRQQAHIVFDAQEKRAFGHAGCNRFFAGYELDEAAGRLRFSKAGSTMMACPDMSVEDAFLKALAQVDNYSIGEDGRLSLNKARMAPLMRFAAGE
ncbi:MAG: copper resistance protein NlpE N-terminal domain-containing protein [Flavobacteriales bacterium]|nr:copper resistance protein NlpE N-terminal domain-containing protein [Flavobacteriales bacterium]